MAVVLFAVPSWGATYSTFEALKDAIESKDVSDTDFTLNAGTYTISQDKFITVSRSIKINAGGTVTIKGEEAKSRDHSVFVFTKNASGATISGFTFDSLILESGDNTGGAAILVDGAGVTIENCKFTNNKVSGKSKANSGGAGIYTKNANGTIIKNCTFSKNEVGTAKNESGGNGVYNLLSSGDATITITGSTFSENAIKQQTGTYSAAKENHSGGGLMNVVTGGKLTVTVENSSFDKNVVGRYGGAIFNTVDSTKTASIDITVKGSTFDSNRIDGYNNNGSFGGAIACYSASGYGSIKLTLSDSIFKNNQAYNVVDLFQTTSKPKIGANGGAIVMYTYTSDDIVQADITNCVFEGNKSNMGGAIMNWGNSGKATMNITDCTFISNDATWDSHFAGGRSKYPIGGAVVTKAVADGGGTSGKAQGTATTTIVNSTFYGNKSVSGGAVANFQDPNQTVTRATTNVVNCTFVDNEIDMSTVSMDKVSPDVKSADIKGKDIYTTDGGTITLINTLLWHTSADSTPLVNRLRTGKVILENSAYFTNAIIASSDASGDIIKTTSPKVITSFASASTPQTFTSNDITHTYFKPTSDLVAGKVSGDVTPKYDIVGILRSTSTPTIGAVEYVDTSKYKIVAAGTVVQSDGKTLSGDIKTSFDVTFSVSGDLNVDEVSVDWEASPTSIAGLTFASGKLTGTPTASADKTLTVTASKVTIKATGYVLAEDISGDFRVLITSADAAKSDETKTDDTTGKTTVKSPDLTVKITSTTLTIAAGSSADLTATVTSGDTTVSDATLTWTAKSTLPTGFSISGSKLVVASTVTSGDYTAGVVATAAKSGYNDGTTSADITVTVTVTSSGTNTGGGSGTPATDTGTQTSTDGSTVTLNETDKTQVVVLATNGSIASLLNVLTKGYAINTADGSAFAIKSTNAITATDLANLLTYEFKVTLDLSDAPATITTVNLASAKMPELKISNNKNIRSLTFTKGSNVPKVSARGSNVQTLDLAGNENIKDLDIGETQVEAVDFEGTKVENLSADKSASLGELKNINSCKTTLKTLGIDGCAIAFVDLNGFTKLTNVQLGSQSPKGWGFRRRFSWFAFFFTYGGMTAPSDITESSDIGSRVTNIGAFDVSGNELTVTSDDTGEVSINGDATAFNYEFDSKAQEASSDVSGGSLRASASNVNPAMNVQISGSTTGGDETVGGSGGGCEVGFGIAALMALAFFINKKH